MQVLLKAFSMVLKGTKSKRQARIMRINLNSREDYYKMKSHHLLKNKDND